MSRIRSIKPDFWSSEEVMALSRDARLLFIGIWNFADDHGRFKWSPATLRAQVFPRDTDITDDVVAAWLEEIRSQGLLFRFVNPPEDSGALANPREISFGLVTGWHHQRVSHPSPSKLPDPKQCLPFPESSRIFANPPEHSRLIHSTPPRSAKRETASLGADAPDEGVAEVATGGHGQPKAKKPRPKTERGELFDAFSAAFELAHESAHGCPHGMTPSLVTPVVNWLLGIASDVRLQTMQRAVDGFFASEHWAKAGKHPLHAFSKAPGGYATAAPAPKPVFRWVGGMP